MLKLLDNAFLYHPVVKSQYIFSSVFSSEATWITKEVTEEEIAESQPTDNF